jgi:hypothetical protein
MTKLDFTAVKDARVGEKEVQRIYRGETKVWNKYCWEKWSCSTQYKKSITVATDGDPVYYNADAEVGVTPLYKTLTKKDGYYLLSNRCEQNAYTYGTAYSAGYRYRPVDGLEVYPGEFYFKLSSRVTQSGVEKIKSLLYEVKESFAVSGYSKGTTLYGTVEGSAGDYPDNGRHSDGYWYVRINPFGVKEE